jgi:hypothetical protein
MRRPRRARLGLWASWGGVGACAALACNAVLGIEVGSAKPLDAALPDSAPDTGTSLAPSRCATDAECVAPNGCYTGRCDTALGACAYDLCHTAGTACSAGRCDTARSTCADDRAYGFRATSYKLDVALDCKGDTDACVAGAYPFLFLETTDGTVALRVDDVLATAATKVPVTGLGFHPASLVTSGRRVWLLGEVQGTGGAPPYELPIAFVDVPSDPTAPALAATSVTLAYPFLGYAAFPAPNGALYLADNDAALGFPTALLAPPLPGSPTLTVASASDAGAQPPDSIPMYRLAAGPPGATLVASSGARVLAHRFGAQLVNLISDPGSPKAALGPDLVLSPVVPAYVPPRFAQGPDGTVFLTGPVNADPPPPSIDCSCYSHERVQWVLPNALATTLDVSLIVDTEAYASPQTPGGVCHQCNPSYVTLPSLGAWIDGKTLIVAAPASDPNRGLMSTRVVTRDPIGAPSKRHTTTNPMDVPAGNFAVDHIALVASAGLGYEVLADSMGNQVTLAIFDPRCDAP